MDKDKMDRRDFFLKAGKLAIPTLGILGLSLTGFARKTEAAGCGTLCSGTCYGACTGCTGSCTSTCLGTCYGSCQNTCSGMKSKN